MKAKIIGICAVVTAFTLAGCGGAASGSPAATHTVTVTPSPSPNPSPSASAVPGTPAPPVPAPTGSPTGIQATTPWSVVSEYYGDIESGDYQNAYALLSSGSVTGQTYDQFVAGFACTSYEGLTDLGTTGDSVEVSVQAAQCDGTVNQYQGTYTVQNGLITAADIQQIG